jgi:hypothetical protein
VTHNGGTTWSKPRLISGDLDEAFVSVPTVTSDGRIFVAFMNTDDLNTGRDDYKVVEVDPATGAALGDPVDVGLVIDGFTDYPVALGRPTYQDSIFRTWAAGNITADPTNPAHLAVVWSDMRGGATIPDDLNPYESVTNSDVVVSESYDGGATWSTPTAIALTGDQFMPWGAFDNTGTLRAGFFDRSVDPTNEQYTYSLATESAPGGFTTAPVATALSDPTKNDRWFAQTLNPAFPNATAFLGDYSNIAAVPGSTAGVVAYWTDMRNENCWGLAPGCGRHGEDAYFARVG